MTRKICENVDVCEIFKYQNKSKLKNKLIEVLEYSNLLHHSEINSPFKT